MNWTFENEIVTIYVTTDPKATAPAGLIVIRVEPIDLYESIDAPAIMAEVAQSILEGVKAWGER